MSSYLVGAYAVFWVGVFLYLLSLGARQRALSRRLDQISALVEDHDADRS